MLLVNRVLGILEKKFCSISLESWVCRCINPNYCNNFLSCKHRTANQTTMSLTWKDTPSVPLDLDSLFASEWKRTVTEKSDFLSEFDDYYKCELDTNNAFLEMKGNAEPESLLHAIGNLSTNSTKNDTEPTPVAQLKRRPSSSSYSYYARRNSLSVFRNTSLASLGASVSSAFFESIGSLGSISSICSIRINDIAIESQNDAKQPPQVPAAMPFGMKHLPRKPPPPSHDPLMKSLFSTGSNMPDLLDESSHSSSSSLSPPSTDASKVCDYGTPAVIDAKCIPPPTGKQVPAVQPTLSREDSLTSTTCSLASQDDGEGDDDYYEEEVLTPKKPSASNKLRKRNRKKDPELKIPVDITDRDVLLGRGGRSNHHPGNIEYRRRILDLQPVYKQLTREEKTPFSESVVSWVKDRGGRFLKEDKEQEFFYQVTDKAAREKVSQALREDHTLAGRLAKKAKLASPKSRKPSENSKKAKKGARKQSKHSLQH
mmetsp:Transcript_19731/g.36824  ORF Transcript_19731/g.36824 Transcript_19731/m.36824 type:complete len:485 (-) Transcript_19731:568-2022(-)